MRWVVSVVELSTPTEKTIGPFETSAEAGIFIKHARESGQWERERWQRVGTLQLFPPPVDVALNAAGTGTQAVIGS